MLPVSVLTLGLLGGYIFALRWYPTRISALRSQGHRLIFLAAIWGVVFLFVATVVVSVLTRYEIFQQIGDLWLKFVPIQNSGRTGIALLIGATLWIPLNWLGRKFSLKFSFCYRLSKQRAADRQILDRQDPLELLVREALGTGRLISVTVSHGKVYIGWVLTGLNPAFDTESIDLIVSRSGHRDPETQEMTIDIDYDKALFQAMKDDLRKQFRRALEDVVANSPANTDRRVLIGMARRRASREVSTLTFQIVIPIEQVRSANFFEEDIYTTVTASRAAETPPAGGNAPHSAPPSAFLRVFSSTRTL